jgi:TPR repeat protein
MKTLTLILSLIITSLAFAEEPAELSERRQAWETQRSEAQGKVDKLYFEELDKLKKNFVQAGNLPAARAIDNAIKGEAKTGKQPEALIKLSEARSKSLEKALKPLDKQYWQDLKKLKVDFQKQGSLAGIDAANAEIEKVLAAYKKPEPPKKKAEVAKEKAEEKQADAPKANNNPKAAAILEQAKGKDAQFQYDLAQRYFKGDGVDKDEKIGVQLLLLAAEQNHARACEMLGCLYRDGRHGTRQNYKKAAEWYQRAAELGYSSSQHYLGAMYLHGRGVRKDGDKAVEWMCKAADQGNAAAMRDLGNIYRDGNGVAKDEEKAAEWFRRGADKGFRDCQYALGKLYRDGDGVPKDKEKAAEWFRKAADQGHKEAKMDLELLK